VSTPAWELRPLGVGDIIDRVFAIYRSRLAALLAIASIPYLTLVLALVYAAFSFRDTFFALAPLLADPLEPRVDLVPAAVWGQLVLFGGIVGVLALATTLVQSGSLVYATAQRYMGQDARVETALLAGLRAAPRLLVMGIVAMLAIFALWVVIFVFMGLTREWWSVLIGTLGGLFLTAYAAASWMVSPPVAIIEGAGPVASLRRSWRLSDGHRWRIVGLIALLVILQVVLSSLLSFVLVASVGADQFVQVAVQQGVNLLASIAWAPVYWGTFAVLYYDLRVRKEALDLQMAAEALPRA
jgi:hypothetical protein